MTTRATAATAMASFRKIIRALHAQSSRIEAAVGLTGPQLWALREIVADDGLSLGELARKLALHPANAGRLVDRLAAKRLIRRATSRDDARVVIVRASARGRKIARAPGERPLQADLLARLEGLPAGELKAVDAALALLVTLAGAEDVEPAPIFERESENRSGSRVSRENLRSGR